MTVYVLLQVYSTISYDAEIDVIGVYTSVDEAELVQKTLQLIYPNCDYLLRVKELT